MAPETYKFQTSFEDGVAWKGFKRLSILKEGYLSISFDTQDTHAVRTQREPQDCKYRNRGENMTSKTTSKDEAPSDHISEIRPNRMLEPMKHITIDLINCKILTDICHLSTKGTYLRPYIQTFSVPSQDIELPESSGKPRSCWQRASRQGVDQVTKGGLRAAEACYLPF